MIAAMLCVGALGFFIAGCILGVIFNNEFHAMTERKFNEVISGEGAR
jgi:hypothetical protein